MGAATSLGLGTTYGIGRHIIFVTSKKGIQIASYPITLSPTNPSSTNSNAYQTSMSAEIFYAMSMGFLKLSILALYGSIFLSRRFHHALWALGIFTVSWSLMVAIGAICQCLPIQSFWDDSIEGHCIQFGILQIIATVCNIITDFVILFLPIRQVRRLHASKEKKRWIYFSFAMGGR